MLLFIYPEYVQDFISRFKVLNISKLLVCGPPGVGKTFLIEHLKKIKNIEFLEVGSLEISDLNKYFDFVVIKLPNLSNSILQKYIETKYGIMNSKMIDLILKNSNNSIKLVDSLVLNLTIFGEDFFKNFSTSSLISEFISMIRVSDQKTLTLLRMLSVDLDINAFMSLLIKKLNENIVSNIEVKYSFLILNNFLKLNIKSYTELESVCLLLHSKLKENLDVKNVEKHLDKEAILKKLGAKEIK